MKTLIVTLALARALDTTTSLATFAKGGHEANPLVISQKPSIFVAQMATETAGQLLLMTYLEKKGHSRWARAIGLVQIGASTAATVNNVVEFKRQSAIKVPTQWCDGVHTKC